MFHLIRWNILANLNIRLIWKDFPSWSILNAAAFKRKLNVCTITKVSKNGIAEKVSECQILLFFIFRLKKSINFEICILFTSSFSCHFKQNVTRIKWRTCAVIFGTLFFFSMRNWREFFFKLVLKFRDNFFSVLLFHLFF